MKTPQRSTIISVAAVVGWVVLTASVWAWALGFVVWHGAVVGAVLGPPVGICLGWLFTNASETGDLNGLRRLMYLLEPEFSMVVSDQTVVFPGEPGYSSSRLFRTAQTTSSCLVATPSLS